jgi:hypothetical protein
VAQLIKDLVNFLSLPAIYFTIFVVAWWAMMKYYRIWTEPKFMWGVLIGSLGFLGFALTDAHFFKEASKADNIPIWFMSYGVGFCFWIAMRRGYINDELMAKGEPNLEKQESGQKVYTWPDLVYSELICGVFFAAFLIGWAILVQAPLEDPANAGITPAIAKAPWYFLGLQEMLVYYDPWIAGVVLPGLIVVGLIAQPYIDINPKGNGYYTVKERFYAIWVWGFGFVVLWISLIFLGTFMRGPGWNFFGPFEPWNTHKVEALNNINLSEIIWVKFLNVGLPGNILVRESFGLILVVVYLAVIPPLLASTKLKDLYEKMGFMRFYILITLALIMLSLPIKMYLRWGLNLKYIVSIPEYLFNI